MIISVNMEKWNVVIVINTSQLPNTRLKTGMIYIIFVMTV